MITEPPVIDVSGLSSGNLLERKAVAAKIGSACRGPGFFYATGHGFSPDTFTAMLEASRQFFALPPSEKRALARSRVGNDRGYVDFQEERLDLSALPDQKEAFNIGREPSIVDASQTQRHVGANAWPDLPNWRPLMLDYYARCLDLGRLLHRAFSLDLGVTETYFDDKLDCPMAILRLLHYSPLSANPEGAPAAGAHTDYGNLTLLIDNGVGGLQIQPRNGDWISAPNIAGSFICNIGDCLMRWSNDLYVSTPHRVLPPEVDRYSIAFFLEPNGNAIVEPIVTDSAVPAKYPPITAAEHVASRINPTYQK